MAPYKQGISDEISRLTETQFQLAIEVWSALAPCRGPEELIDWNRRMPAKMTEHCSAEIATLSQITMRMALRPADADAHESA
jgi:hypothetical protein